MGPETPGEPKDLWDIAHSDDTPLPEGFDVNNYEVRNPVSGEWEEIEEIFVADEHSVNFGDDEPETYIDLITSGDHYTVGPDDSVEIRRKPAGVADTPPDPDGQPAWENQVREILRESGYDPDDIEGQVEGFGQDYFEYADDPAAYVDSILEETQRVDEGGVDTPTPKGMVPREEETDIEAMVEISNPRDHAVRDDVSGEWDTLVGVTLVEEDEENGNSYLVETDSGEFHVTEGETVMVRYKGEFLPDPEAKVRL
jgi:hypothetical protein